MQLRTQLRFVTGLWLALWVTALGLGQTITAPRLTTISLTSSATLSAGGNVALAYTATDNGTGIGSVQFRYTDPINGWLYISASGATGTPNYTLPSTAVSGTYRLDVVFVNLPGGGNVTYYRDGSISQFPSGMVGPSTHSLNFSAADFVVSFRTAYEVWKISHFTPTEQSQPSVSGPNAIYGQDGLPNAVKYALGLPPKSNATTGLPTLTSDATNWTYTFTKLTSVTDATCTVEVSTNLASWTSIGVTQTLVSSSGGVDTWQATFPVALAPNAFFRLRVDLP